MPERSTHALFGNRLLLVLNRRNMSVADAAKLVGMTPGQLSKIAVGKTDPTATTIERICEGLQISPAELLQGQEVS